MNRILITGGTGLIGKNLISILLKNQYEVAVFTRQKSSTNQQNLNYFQWDPKEIDFETSSLDFKPNIIVNLAGENVGEGAWTNVKRQEILSSRLNSIQTLKKFCDAARIKPKVISISASGYYGDVSSLKKVQENEPSGNGFLAEVCRSWEDEALKAFGDPNFKLLIFRLGVVLSLEGGALPQMLRPVRFAFGQPLGCGTQMISWIHIQDVVESLIFAIQNPQIQGIFNLAAPEPVSNKKFIKELANANKRLFVPLCVPEILIRLMLGNQADLVLQGVAMDITSWKNTGYNFNFPELKSALKNIFDLN